MQQRAGNKVKRRELIEYNCQYEIIFAVKGIVVGKWVNAKDDKVCRK
jgi:hypothetical protein